MFPPDLHYTKEHLWAKAEGDFVRVGITNFAQEQLGDIVFVQLPEPGDQLQAGESFGTIESVKSVSDLFAPLSGRIVEVNDALDAEPEIINQDPYGKGWILLLEPADPAAVEQLMDAEEYRAAAEA